jgi:hypothetical protein
MNEPEAAVWMGRMVELCRNEGALPDPALIWWRARLLERQDARARVARPIAIAQGVSLVVAVATAVALCAVNWPGIQGMLQPLGFALWAAAGGAVVVTGLALRFVFGE